MKVYFYIITCKNQTIQTFYLGKTNNLKARTNLHRFHSTQTSHCDYKVYKEINSNGGWNNWELNIVFEDEFTDDKEAVKKECELYDLLNPPLNSKRPIRLPKEHPERVEYNRQKKREFDIRKRLKKSSL